MNWNNLVKEPGYINRFTRGFCVVAMARALGVSTEAIDATLGKANTEAEAEAEAERPTKLCHKVRFLPRRTSKLSRRLARWFTTRLAASGTTATVRCLPLLSGEVRRQNVERAEASYAATKE